MVFKSSPAFSEIKIMGVRIKPSQNWPSQTQYLSRLYHIKKIEDKTNVLSSDAKDKITC